MHVNLPGTRSGTWQPHRVAAGAMIYLFATSAGWCAGSEPGHRGFHALDWTIVGLYGAALIGIGFYYARRQKTTEEYFVANRSMKPILAGISLFATMFSTLTYIATPGEWVQYGPVVLVMSLAATPFIYLVVGWVIIPKVMRLPVTSAYELLETRLGTRVRLLGAFIFVATRLVWMALLLYATATVLVKLGGWPPAWIPAIAVFATAVTAVYTLYGGIEAVVITDAVQLGLMLLGAFLTVALISYSMGGIAPWWPDRWADHWAQQPFFSTDPRVRVTMVGTFAWGLLWWVCISLSDQMAIQRYLSTRDVKSARRALLHSCLSQLLVMGLLGLVGAALLAFYRSSPEIAAGTLNFTKNGDGFFPHFISHYMPLGLPGLLVTGLLAAAMSSLSSGINSTIVVISKDIIGTFWPRAFQSDQAKLRSALFLGLGVSLVTLAGSAGMGLVPGNLLEVTSKTVNLFTGPIVGPFFLAMFIRFGTPFGAIMGVIYSLTAAVMIGYWDVFTGGVRVSFQWILPGALIVSLSTSTLFSLLPTCGRSPAVNAGYTAAVLAPLLGFLFWALA